MKFSSLVTISLFFATSSVSAHTSPSDHTTNEQDASVLQPSLRGQQHHRSLNVPDPKTIQMKGAAPVGNHPLALASSHPLAAHLHESTVISEEEKKAIGILASIDPVSQEPVAAVATDDSSSPASQKTKSRRKFISYVPSRWESVWKDGIHGMETKQTICEEMLGDEFNHLEHLRGYMNVMCATRYEPPNHKWCILKNDPRHTIYYNLEPEGDMEVFIDQTPAALEGVEPPSEMNTIKPHHDDDDVFSKFIFLDEVTGDIYEEFIEPLVAHLRFPLAGCIRKETDPSLDLLTWYVGYMLPPPLSQHRYERMLYFEFGGDVYKRMEYQVNHWNPDHIWTYPTGMQRSAMFKHMPEEIKQKVTRQTGIIAVTAPTTTEGEEFIPDFINSQAETNDYVLWKLDKGTPDVKGAYIDALLNDEEKKYHVDEIIWQNNIERNYIFRDIIEAKKPQPLSDETFNQVYTKLFELRGKGIRSHLYV